MPHDRAPKAAREPSVIAPRYQSPFGNALAAETLFRVVELREQYSLRGSRQILGHKI